MKKLVILLCSFTLTCSLTSQDYWEHIHSNDSSTIWSLAIAKNGTMYYGGNSGLFISEDDGVNWEYKYLALNHFIFDLAFDLDSNLICAADEKIYKYKVEDESWELMLQPELNQQFYAILVDSSYIFVGSSHAGLFRYDGDNWLQLENNTIAGIRKIIRDKENRLILCGTNFTSDNSAIAESTDDGETWTLLGLDASYLEDVATDSQNRIYTGSTGNTIYGIGGLYRYNRDENIWDTLRLYHRVQSILFTEEDSLYIGQYSTGGPPAGAFVSDDYGFSWVNISSGFLGPSIPNVEELTLGSEGHLFCILQDNNSIYKSVNPIIVSTKLEHELQKEKFSVYPNPFYNDIHISFKDDVCLNGFISLFDLQGFVILDRKRISVTEGKAKITNLDYLPHGFYLLKLESMEEIKTIKLIKF